jgi:UMF1 family MFS transporter
MTNVRSEIATPPPERRRRREIIGYCMFDFANSSYTTLISTVAFSAYFRQVVVGANDPRADFLWGAAGATGHAILIFTAPVLGALADFSGRKKLFLMLTAMQTVVLTSLLFLVRPGDVALGMVLFVAATLGFEGGYVFYNAFLPEVSTPRTIARVSGWSWGTGFIGGLAALLACLPLLRRPLLDPDSGLVDPQAVFDYRLSFVVVALFFAVFSVPTFLFLPRDRGRGAGKSLPEYATAGFRRVAQTLRSLRRHREAAKFVAAALFFYGGIEAVIKFSAIYAMVSFGIEGLQLLLLFIFSNIVAFPGTLAAGYVGDWIGGRRALALTLVLWVGVLVMGALATTQEAFWVMAGGAAIGMGSTQALGRSLMAQLSPLSRESEFMGFYLLAQKIGSVLGLLLFGTISSMTGNQRLAVLWLLPLFGAGLVLTLAVDESEAR